MTPLFIAGVLFIFANFVVLPAFVVYCFWSDDSRGHRSSEGDPGR